MSIDVTVNAFVIIWRIFNITLKSIRNISKISKVDLVTTMVFKGRKNYKFKVEEDDEFCHLGSYNKGCEKMEELIYWRWSSIFVEAVILLINLWTYIRKGIKLGHT